MMDMDTLLLDLDAEIEEAYPVRDGEGTLFCVTATISVPHPWNDRAWGRIHVLGGDDTSFSQSITTTALFAKDVLDTLNTPEIYGEAVRNDYYPDMILDFSMKMDGTAVSCRAYHKDRTMSPPVHSHYPSIREAFLGAASLYVKQRSSDG